MKLDRAERRKVLALAQRREIDAVLVTELSRWGRSTTDLLATLKELEARRVSLVALNGMAFDLTTPHGRMMVTLLAGLAEFERELTVERIRSGIAAAKARQEAGPAARAAAEVGPPRAQGAGPHRPGPQLPPGRARGRAEQEHRRRHREAEPGYMNTREFEFRRWENWLEERAQTLRQAGWVAELRRGGPPTPKPGCSFRMETDRALGQFDVWATGEADFDVMDAQTKGFAHNVWGMMLDDISFEAAFDDFLNRVAQHPTPGRNVPASLRSTWFSVRSVL